MPDEAERWDLIASRRPASWPGTRAPCCTSPGQLLVYAVAEEHTTLTSAAARCPSPGGVPRLPGRRPAKTEIQIIPNGPWRFPGSIRD
jgi:hypothetical protein